MVSLYKVIIEPLTPLTFKALTPLEAGLHGPSTAASSLDYPLPSTVAGGLASLRFEQCRECRNTDSDGMSDIKCCLKEFFGEGFHLYGGLAQVLGSDDLYAYTPFGFVRMERILQHLSKKDINWDGVEGFRPRRTVRFGIALNRSRKRVMEGMLYRVEAVLPVYGEDLLSYVFLMASGRELKPSVIRMERGLVKMSIRRSLGKSVEDVLMKGSGNGSWRFMLLTPALTDDIPSGSLITMRTPLELGESLIGDKCSRPEVIYVPKASGVNEVIFAGYSLAKQSLREPYIALPPGTVVEGKCDIEEVRRIVKGGLGRHTDLGWGTVIAAFVL